MDEVQSNALSPRFQSSVTSACVSTFGISSTNTRQRMSSVKSTVADYPELLTEDGKWYFNTSIAEQTNVWLGGYHAICREMLPVNFFLNEMIRLRNCIVVAKLKEDGQHPAMLHIQVNSPLRRLVLDTTNAPKVPVHEW
jgi:hypothetical protein